MNMNSFRKMTRLNISSCQHPSCLILMLNKDFLEIVFNGHGIRYLKKKLKRMQSSLQFVCLGKKKNIMKGFCGTVAVSTLVMHLWSQSFGRGCKPKIISSLESVLSAVDRNKIPFVQIDDQSLRILRFRSPFYFPRN